MNNGGFSSNTDKRNFIDAICPKQEKPTVIFLMVMALLLVEDFHKWPPGKSCMDQRYSPRLDPRLEFVSFFKRGIHGLSNKLLYWQMEMTIELLHPQVPVKSTTGPVIGLTPSGHIE